MLDVYYDTIGTGTWHQVTVAQWNPETLPAAA